jgi:HlyD family secretion protein
VIARRTAGLALAAVAALAGLGYAMRPRAVDLPTTIVQRGEFVDAIRIRGEVKASRSIIIAAPADAGELRIVTLVPNGAVVREGDVVVEFDAATVSRTLEERLTERRGLEAEIERVRVQARTREEEHVTAVTKAQYDLERARLDYSAHEILSRVEGEQRRLAVLDAEQTVREVTAALESGRRVTRTELAVAEQRRDKAQFDLDKARRQLGALRIRAPSGGSVSLLVNFRSGGFGNQQEFRQGDAAWPGAAIAELPDASSLYVAAKVDEVERGRLSPEQPVSVRVDAVPDRELAGRIQSISTIAKADFSTWPPPRNFDLGVTLSQTDERLKPGMSAAVRVAVERVADALLLPAEAVFAEAGEDVVYVVDGRRVRRRPVVVQRRTAEQVVVATGVAAGDRVALKRPESGR